jgi:hypothetical protein
MTNRESRPAPPPETGSADPASPANPAPGRPPDRLDFDPVPLRRREDGLTPEKQRLYVEALADTGVAREAAARVGLSEQAINRVRRRSDARSFDHACEAAHMFGARRLRSIAYERAVEGTLKGRYFRGERVSEERVYDNRLLVYLLGKVAHLLEPPPQAKAICADWERHMDALERGAESPDAPASNTADDWTGEEVWQDEAGVWWTVFPPPAGFDGVERGQFDNQRYYERTLSAREQAALDADTEAQDAEDIAAQTALRDRFFGFAGDENLSSTQAEPYETSEPSDPDPGPLEYKSAFPPAPAACLSGQRDPLRASAPPRESFPRRSTREAPNLSPAPGIP